MGRNASSKQISLTAGYERKEYLVLIFEKPTLHLCFSNCFLHLCVCVFVLEGCEVDDESESPWWQFNLNIMVSHIALHYIMAS